LWTDPVLAKLQNMNRAPSPPGPAALCLLAAVLFGATPLLCKGLLPALGPLRLAGLLYLGAAGAVLPWAFADRALVTRPRLGPALKLIAAVILGGGLAPVLLLQALARAPAASVSLWLSLETVFTGALAAVVFREHLGARGWAANACIFAGSALVAAPEGAHLGTGGLLAGGACLAWALDNNLTANLTELTPAQLTLVKGLCAGAVNLGLGMVGHGGGVAPRPVLVALAVGALGYGASLVLYIRGGRELGAARAQMIFAVAPFVGVLLAWVAGSEAWSTAQLLAAGLLAAGLALLHAERHLHAHHHSTLQHTHEHGHDDGHHQHQHPDLAPGTRHTHAHDHQPQTHAHPHLPDLHHRHDHA
jgi:drug/metabolite transporter (DMT)-like permease